MHLYFCIRNLKFNEYEKTVDNLNACLSCDCILVYGKHLSNLLQGSVKTAKGNPDLELILNIDRSPRFVEGFFVPKGY